MKFLLTLIVSLGTSVAISKGQQCEVNEVYKECGDCDQNCDYAVECTQECNPGCYCIDGYVRFVGICIPLEKCPNYPDKEAYPIENSGQQCSVNEEYSECGTCDQNCDYAVVCTQECKPGCYCYEGYVRYLGICIPQEKCPNSPDKDAYPIENSGPKQCDFNEVYILCGGCDQYCNSEQVVCDASCRPGCYCRHGYKRSFPGGICLQPEACPQYQEENQPLPQDPGYHCGPNEVFQYCGVGWQCEDYCGRGANACAYCEDGCYCKPGYIRSGPEYDAECIPEDHC